MNVEPISAALASQFADLIPRGAGLQLTRIGQASPAEEAGLRKYDILVNKSKRHPLAVLMSWPDCEKLINQATMSSSPQPRASRLQEVVVRLGARNTTSASVNTTAKVPPQSWTGGRNSRCTTCCPLPGRTGRRGGRSFEPALLPLSIRLLLRSFLKSSGRDSQADSSIGHTGILHSTPLYRRATLSAGRT
ncbi:MAG: hypothetical protein R3C11_09665 [Planctomycetaceae bacterium]